MVVEKNTGIMLKFLSFHEGMIQYSITTEWIQINKRLRIHFKRKAIIMRK